MKTSSYVLLLTCSALVTLTQAAHAQTVSVGTDTTISSTSSGSAGAIGAPDAVGQNGGIGIDWTAIGVDVIFSGLPSISGGNGGNGGVDASNNGGNTGGNGGNGLNAVGFDQPSVITTPGTVLSGGDGGNGSNGGTGGASDTNGGNGGLGGIAIDVSGNSASITIDSSTVTGGDGGDGGAAGDAGGDAANTASGGTGSSGGTGIQLDSNSSSVVNIYGTSVVSGGNGGDGGLSLAADDNWNLRADYDFEGKKDYTAHSGFLRAAYKF